MDCFIWAQKNMFGDLAWKFVSGLKDKAYLYKKKSVHFVHQHMSTDMAQLNVKND